MHYGGKTVTSPLIGALLVEINNNEKEFIMKDYFISFEFWAYPGATNKFLTAIIKVDLSSEQLNDVALNLIKKHCPEMDISEVSIQINAFNLV